MVRFNALSPVFIEAEQLSLLLAVSQLLPPKKIVVDLPSGERNSGRFSGVVCNIVVFSGRFLAAHSTNPLCAHLFLHNTQSMSSTRGAPPNTLTINKPNF